MPEHDRISQDTFTFSERRDRLEALLQDTENLWRPSTFHERRPEWCATHPQLADELLALDDPSLARLSADSSRSARWLASTLPPLSALPELVDLSPLPNSTPVRTRKYHGVSNRKVGQIDAFFAAVGRPVAPLVEWCAGKGHLSRRFLSEWGGEAMAVERNATLCAAGEVLARRSDHAQRFVTADVMHESTADSLRGAHAVALHACGDLHRRLLEAAAQVRAPAIDVAPCCYQLTSDDVYRPMSASDSAFKLNRNALKLAVTETVTSTPRRIAASAKASAWKLAFVHLREHSHPGAAYQTFQPVPSLWQKDGFTSFLTRLAERENISIPAGFHFDDCEAEGWKRHHESRRLQLVRLSFRRALEVWILCDLAVWLEHQGYSVTLGEFCERSLTPRNLLLSARLA